MANIAKAMRMDFKNEEVLMNLRQRVIKKIDKLARDNDARVIREVRKLIRELRKK